MEIKNVTVIGAGTMGNGIAQVFAMHAFNVTLCDISNEALERALKTIRTNLDRMVNKGLVSQENAELTVGRVSISTDTSRAVASADLVVEAATENFELKKKIFSQIDKATHPNCILATNTSSISITSLAAATSDPSRVIGMHFMNPVPVMKLVEIIRGYSTSDHACKVVMDLSKSMGKEPVEVNDYPGFVANRILMPMINEAVYTLYEGVAGVREIDTVMKLGMAHPMGPLALADFIGLDVCVSILNIMQAGLGNQKYAPCPLLVNMVNAGKLGKKSGEGFYVYQEGSKEADVSPRLR
jgi:3-hydroxybutyryl-CoA dehydrogenase